MFALSAEVSFDRFGKELCFVGVCLGDFVVVAQCWIVVPTLRLEEVFDFVPRSLFKLIELKNFSQLACDSTLKSSLTCFCNWLMHVFTAGSLIWEYCLLSLRFSLISAKVFFFSSHAFGFRNGSINCSANCTYNKVSVLIQVTSGHQSRKVLRT